VKTNDPFLLISDMKYYTT